MDDNFTKSKDVITCKEEALRLGHISLEQNTWC
jgi:hypothetical protein